GAKNLEEAFIGHMEDAIAEGSTKSKPAKEPAKEASSVPAPAAPNSKAAPAHGHSPSFLPLRRMLAYSRNEAIQIMRDPIRLAFAFLGSALLMIVCGFGITTDVEHVRMAAFDRDQSQDSRTYIKQFRSVERYFRWEPPIYSEDEALRRLQADDVSTVVEIPTNFSRDLRRNNRPEVLAQGAGANPSRSTGRGFRTRPATTRAIGSMPRRIRTARRSRNGSCTTRRSRVC